MRWIATTLLALLALAYAIVALSAPSAEVRPAPDDTGLGGLSLLSAALRDAGYRVAFDRSARPRLSADDVAIVPVVDGHQIPPAVLDHVARGGRAFVLGVPSDLQPIVGAVEAVDSQGSSLKIDETGPAPALPTEPEGWLPPATAWQDEYGPLATLGVVGKGRMVRLDNGALATNRFLGRRDNARVVLSSLSALAKPPSQLVYVAGGYGEAEALGPIEAIGPWAVGALWQTLAALAAYGVARGVRFGLPAPDVPRKSGARELLDAVASHYRRGRRTDAPLAVAARERPDDATIRSLIGTTKVSEADARRILVELESRPRRR